MRRLWVGVIPLLAVLIVGIGLTVAFERIHEPMAEKLEQASAAALQGDWEKALALTGEVRAEWEKYRGFAAAVADHEPLEQIDGLLAQLKVWEKQQEPTGYATTCQQLAQIARAMADSQRIIWWNLL